MNNALCLLCMALGLVLVLYIQTPATILIGVSVMLFGVWLLDDS